MPHPRQISAVTRAALANVPWRQTPTFTPNAIYPWRVWHHERFGGSPIPLRLTPGQAFSHTRLFLGPSRVELGDLAHPAVDGIVNLCIVDDAWPLSDLDRRWLRGEGMHGYSWETLDDDARAVAALLRAGHRMLIHCMAGMNRAATLTTATLMRVEGINAADALCRVQRFHPLAHPEDRHWLALRQLEVVIRAEDAAMPDA